MPIKSHAIVVFVLLTLMQLASACSSSVQTIQDEGWVIFPAEQASEQGIGN